MFEKFGEFNSVEELNRAAAGMLQEGDIKSLRELGKENGIDEDDVQDYIDGCVKQLATGMLAAMGKLYVEEQEFKKKKDGVGEKAAAKVLFVMARTLCTKEEFCNQVMKKGKRLMNVYKLMKEEASKHKEGNSAVACGTDRELNQIIVAYYSGGDDAVRKAVKSLWE